MPSLTLHITEQAIFDMDKIFSYIAQDNLSAAKEIIESFNKKFESLLLFPESGFKPSKLKRKNIRVCVVAKHYQIIYFVKNNNLFIQRVLTGYQDVFAIL